MGEPVKLYFKKRVPRYPIQKWQGKWDAHLIRMYLNPHSAESYSKRLQVFLDQFPGYTSLEQFSIAEVTNFIEWRIANGAALNSVSLHLYAVRVFFNWLIESQNLPLINPVRRDYVKNLKRRYALSMKAKSVRERFGDIQFSPSDVGSSIGDEGDIFAFIAGVTEPDQST